MWGRGQTSGFISSLKIYSASLVKNQVQGVDNVLNELYSLKCNVAIDKLVDQKYATVIGYLLGSTLLNSKSDPQKAVNYIYTGLSSQSPAFLLHFIHGLSLSPFLFDSLVLATTISSTQDGLLQIYSVVFREMHTPLPHRFFEKFYSIASKYLGDDLDLLISNKDRSPNYDPSSLLNLYAQFLALVLNTFLTTLQFKYHGQQALKVSYYLRTLLQRDPAILCINSTRVEQLLCDGISVQQHISATNSWINDLSSIDITYITNLDSLTSHGVSYMPLSSDNGPQLLLFRLKMYSLR